MSNEPKMPMDRLLDEIDWQPVPAGGPGADPFPYITHTGILKLAPLGLEVTVHQLSDGKRIIPQDELARIFCALDPSANLCESINPNLNVAAMGNRDLRCQLPNGHKPPHRAVIGHGHTEEW